MESKIKSRIEKLREEISRLRFLYHVKNDPNITDDVYDSLNKELKTLLDKYPKFIDPNAPENRVSGKPLDKFEKVKHEIKMFSIGNVFTAEELEAWEKRNLKLLSSNITLDYFCELKLDGLAISLIYENGELTRGVTRGDGVIGENITSNLKMINSIPLVLKSPFPNKIEVRGEAIINKDILDKLNQKNKKEGKMLFANSRNAAAGSLRQLDSQIAKERELDFFAYEIAQIEGKDWQKHTEKHSLKHELLINLGFVVENHSKKFENLKEIIDFINKVETEREKLPFNIDGVVININETKIFETLGVVGKDPRGIVAYKYPAERATTVIIDITVNVGRTGVQTPVAHFNPTSVAGSTVSKATLHNIDQINRLDIRIGDTVVIQKAGDVIPEIVKVLKNMRTGKEKKFKMPDHCPICNSKIEQKTTGSRKSPVSNGLAPLSPRPRTLRRGAFSAPDSDYISVAFYCSNKHCGARNQRGIEHFVNIFEIYEIGPKIITRLKDEGLISDAADLFTLEKADLSGLERFGEKSADNIISSIEAHKKIPLWRLIYALGIIHVGEQTAQDLANHFGSLEKISKASNEEINEIENIGPVVAESIFQYFIDSSNLGFLDKLFLNGVFTFHQKPNSKKFAGKNFVLTGTLSSMSREEAKKIIIANGGKVSGSVSSKTTYLLAGEEAGSKYKEAEKLKIKIISESEFQKML